MMKFLKNRLPVIIYFLLIIAGILLLPESLYFSKNNKRVEADMLLLIAVFLLPLAFVPIVWPRQFARYYASFVVFGFLGYLLAGYIRKVNIEKEFKTGSVSVSGVVKGKRSSFKTKGAASWNFYCEFEHNGVLYKTFREEDGKNRMNDGDSMTILFLQRNPEISKIVWPNQ